MRKMNLKVTFVLSVLLLVLFSVSADAQNKNMQHKKKTAKFLNKTNVILAAAGERVSIKKVYTGYLKRGTKIQKKGIAHFKKKEFKKATGKSYIARRYAFLAYKANDGTVPKKWRLDANEKTVIQKLFPKKLTNEELKEKVTDEEKEEEKDENGEIEDVEDTEGEDDGAE